MKGILDMIGEISIAGKKLGEGHNTYIVAEMSANHLKDYDRAVSILKAAKESGADAVKVQTYTPDTMTIKSDKEYFKIKNESLWGGRNLFDLYNEAYMPWQWLPKLKQLASDLNVTLFSTPFDETAVEYLEEIDVPAYKIASFEIVDIPLIRRIAKTHKPIILSTGMASIAEIDEAVNAIRGEGAKEIVLLKCTSSYPALPKDMNLITIPHMSQGFNCPVGLSDHTLGIEMPIAAVVFGACMVEKHFTLSRSDPGPDSTFSLEPGEFKAMVKSIHITKESIGKISYKVSEKEEANLSFRKSIFVIEDMKKGDIFSRDNIRSIRPGHGLLPKYLKDILGCKASQNISRGTPLDWKLIGR